MSSWNPFQTLVNSEPLAIGTIATGVDPEELRIRNEPAVDPVQFPAGTGRNYPARPAGIRPEPPG